MTETKKLSIEEILLRREERESREADILYAERAEKAANLKQKQEHRASIDKQMIEKEQREQKYCSHMKGLLAHRKSPVPLYNIYAHQLPDGKFFIKCRNKCGMRWNPGDTREFLFVDGKKVPNHTGFSFEDMWAKLPEDAISRSEIPLTFESVPVTNAA